jgi:hypothetical protein
VAWIVAINTLGLSALGREIVVHETRQQITFAHAVISNEHYFDEVHV